MASLYDNRSIYAVIGDIMMHPEHIDEYNIVQTDFEPGSIQDLVFSTINNIYRRGGKIANPFDIDSYLSPYPQQHEFFERNNGINYCAAALEITKEDNFVYYLHRMKKMSFLRYLASQGYDITKLYDTSISDGDVAASEREQTKFDSMTIMDMIEQIEAELVLQSKVLFCADAQNKGQLLGEGLAALKERFKGAPEFGLPLQSQLLTTVTRGMRLKKLYVRSSASGGGKSRTALADFCNISVPWFYDIYEAKWKYTGLSEPALFISTELEMDELQTIALAYVSGVTEDHILDGRYEEGEEERINKAIEYINAAPLFIEFLPNFSIMDIENLIKKYRRTHGVRYICFDYIHMSAKLIAELGTMTKGMKQLREDQVLFLFIDRLKNLCNTEDVFILTMTQLNGSYKDAKEKDETLLRGAKSIADRVDMGEISLPPNSGEKEAIKGILAKQVGQPEPNMIRHVYKLRRGKLSKIRIYQYADLGTARTKDLFVTNYDGTLLSVQPTEIEVVEEIIKQESINSSDIEMTPEEMEESSKRFLDW